MEIEQRKNVTEQVKTIGALLRLPFEVLLDRVYSELATSGFEDIRPAHGNVFRYISPDGSRLTELADEAQITKQSMNYLVEYLHDRGYVEMIPDPTDGRAKLIRLTNQGQTVQQLAIQISRQVEAEWAAQLGQRKMSQLRRLLEELSNVLIGREDD
ncbi:winged helix-turn-helix transcriptional regulator [Phormidium tenue FACHB-886]|nr:winged helix-turn-helix transcriptional regulator [Phormidium tenue FACHB-886]